MVPPSLQSGYRRRTAGESSGLSMSLPSENGFNDRRATAASSIRAPQWADSTQQGLPSSYPRHQAFVPPHDNARFAQTTSLVPASAIPSVSVSSIPTPRLHASSSRMVSQRGPSISSQSSAGLHVPGQNWSLHEVDEEEVPTGDVPRVRMPHCPGRSLSSTLIRTYPAVYS